MMSKCGKVLHFICKKALLLSWGGDKMVRVEHTFEGRGTPYMRCRCTVTRQPILAIEATREHGIFRLKAQLRFQRIREWAFSNTHNKLDRC